VEQPGAPNRGPRTASPMRGSRRSGCRERRRWLDGAAKVSVFRRVVRAGLSGSIMRQSCAPVSGGFRADPNGSRMTESGWFAEWRIVAKHPCWSISRRTGIAMIFSALMMLLQQPEPIILDEVLLLPPAEAGDLVLSGKTHGPIVSVHEVNANMKPPYVVQLQLVEEAKRSGWGCSRTRWTANFQTNNGHTLGRAVLKNTTGAPEIKLAPENSCGQSDYVYLNPGLNKEAGFAALMWLEGVLAGSDGQRFICADNTGSGLCDDVGMIRQKLAALQPWAVTPKKGHIELWLGTPGEAVTALRFQPRVPELIDIERRIPPPF